MAYLKKNIFSILVTVLGVVSLLLLFASCVNFKGDTHNTYTGFQAIFGHSTKTTLGKVTTFEFSFGGLITIILLVVASVLSLLNLPMKHFIVCVLFVVSGIMIMLIPNMAVINKDAQSLVGLIGGKFELVGQPALYISGVISIVAGVLTFVKPYIIRK